MLFSLKNRIFSFLNAFSNCLREATGWRRAGWAFVFGGVMSLTMPPYDLFPLLWICFPAFVFLLQGCANKKQAFATGWWFAFGFLVLSLYWIAAAMFVDIAKFWWGVPLAVAGLPALFAIYYGLGALLAWKIGTRSVSGSIAVGLAWFAADYARGHMFTGFPWNLTGYAWSGVLPVLQITSIIGIYGLSLITVVSACLFASLQDSICAARKATITSLILFAILALWGGVRLSTTKVADVPGVRLRVVQPNIAQSDKWRISEREADFDKILALTSAPGEQPVTHVIWPETASTFYLSEDSAHRAEIASHIPAAATVMTGVIRRDLDADGNTRFYNSLVAVNGLGKLVAGYDKSHLVPFGEFMPWRKYIPIKTLAASGADFTPGSGARSLRVFGLPPFSPLICYEAIFPGAVVDLDDRPDLMINITNDGWYGKTIGPPQHFAIARIRAIEEGLPLVRAANTGISGIIDPVGRIRVYLPLGKQGVVDGALPTPLPLTFFEQWRDIPSMVVFVILAVAVFVSRITTRFAFK